MLYEKIHDSTILRKTTKRRFKRGHTTKGKFRNITWTSLDVSGKAKFYSTDTFKGCYRQYLKLLQPHWEQKAERRKVSLLLDGVWDLVTAHPAQAEVPSAALASVSLPVPAVGEKTSVRISIRDDDSIRAYLKQLKP